jgi:hypothetical protein
MVKLILLEHNLKLDVTFIAINKRPVDCNNGHVCAS